MKVASVGPFTHADTMLINQIDKVYVKSAEHLGTFSYS